MADLYPFFLVHFHLTSSDWSGIVSSLEAAAFPFFLDPLEGAETSWVIIIDHLCYVLKSELLHTLDGTPEGGQTSFKITDTSHLMWRGDRHNQGFLPGRLHFQKV